MDRSLRFVDLTQGSQTLDLVNDLFQFVTGFFEVISTSAPHIYHSALLLSPRTSSVWKMYGPQTTFTTRVIKGIPTSWDPSIVNSRFLSMINITAWSPCSKFIAVACYDSPEVAVLDATTLKQLHTLCSEGPRPFWDGLEFSPDGHLLTGWTFCLTPDCERSIASWDLQTGGLMGYITIDSSCRSITYSKCGMMLGGYFPGSRSIIIYEILSGTQISSHSVVKGITGGIWTHGEYIQYAIVDPRSITIWEVSFTSVHPPIQARTLPTPGNLSEEALRRPVFLPILSLLTFIDQDRIIVWDAQHQEILLDSICIHPNAPISFSPDGQTLIYGSGYPSCYLCKKSPDGYFPDQKLLLSVGYSFVIPSPDGGSIISARESVLQLWHAHSLSLLQSIPSPAERTYNLYLEFLPDKSSVAIAESSKVVTILDLKSGSPQIVIDVGMNICGMEIIGSEIIVVGSRGSIIWELPAGNNSVGTKWDVGHSISTTTFEVELEASQISISPNLDYMVGINNCSNLSIFDVYTGEELCDSSIERGLLGFTLDGGEVWCAMSGEVKRWKIIEDEIFGIIELECLETIQPLSGFPWHSSCGYQITDDGWIVSSSGRHLLWLPYRWHSYEKEQRRWSGKILALLYYEMPEVVILEVEV